MGWLTIPPTNARLSSFDNNSSLKLTITSLYQPPDFKLFFPQPFSIMTHKNIVLLGATGNLGSYILRALLSASPSFNVTALVRATSKASLPDSVKKLILPDEYTASAINPLLQGQDAVICSFPPGSDTQLQKILADAAVQAGVKLFIPADFGSCDSASPTVLETMALYRQKAEVREYLEGLVAKSKAEGGSFGWTSLIPGHFFDYGLTSELLGFNVKERRVKMFDGGERKWSSCTRARIAEAVVKVLQKGGEGIEGVRRRVLYVQSFCVSQKELLGVLKKVVGGEGKWGEDVVESGPLIKRLKVEVEQTGDSHKREELVCVLGLVDGDWRTREGFANKLLGLEDENLEEVVRSVLVQ